MDGVNLSSAAFRPDDTKVILGQRHSSVVSNIRRRRPQSASDSDVESLEAEIQRKEEKPCIISTLELHCESPKNVPVIDECSHDSRLQSCKKKKPGPERPRF